MAHHTRSIRETLLNLEDVFLSTEDGERFVTDRFTLWRVADLFRHVGGSKLGPILSSLPDGCYKLSAGGAVTANTRYTSVPTCARLIPDQHGDELVMLPFTMDYSATKAHGQVRLWQAPEGRIYAMDARLKMDGWAVHREIDPNGSKLLVVGSDGVVSGVVMQRRMDNLTAAVGDMARHIGFQARVSA